MEMCQMEANVKVDAGICGFKAEIIATATDGMAVEWKIDSSCDIIKQLATLLEEKLPINAIQELGPINESLIKETARPLLITKGCCEACVVPDAICKAMYVAAGLALPKNVLLEITGK